MLWLRKPILYTRESRLESLLVREFLHSGITLPYSFNVIFISNEPIFALIVVCLGCRCEPILPISFSCSLAFEEASALLNI